MSDVTKFQFFTRTADGKGIVMVAYPVIADNGQAMVVWRYLREPGRFVSKATRFRELHDDGVPPEYPPACYTADGSHEANALSDTICKRCLLWTRHKNGNITEWYDKTWGVWIPAKR